MSDENKLGKELFEKRMKILEQSNSSPIKTLFEYIQSVKEFEEKIPSRVDSVSMTCCMLALFALNEMEKVIETCNKCVSHYKIFDDKTQEKSLMKAVYEFKNNPYSNIFQFLEHYYMINSIEISRVIPLCIEIYELRQAEFLSRIYKIISKKNLIQLVRKSYETNFNEYIEKYNLQVLEKKGEYFVSFENFNSNFVIWDNNSRKFKTLSNISLENANLAQELNFINSKTSELENIVKANFVITKK